MAWTLLKMGTLGLSIWRPSWKMALSCYFSSFKQDASRYQGYITIKGNTSHKSVEKERNILFKTVYVKYQAVCLFFLYYRPWIVLLIKLHVYVCYILATSSTGKHCPSVIYC